MHLRNWRCHVSMAVSGNRQESGLMNLGWSIDPMCRLSCSLLSPQLNLYFKPGRFPSSIQGSRYASALKEPLSDTSSHRWASVDHETENPEDYNFVRN